jgi:hypothetical protein
LAQIGIRPAEVGIGSARLQSNPLR